MNECLQCMHVLTTSGGARTSRQPGHFQVTEVVRQVIKCKRQRSKGARSFRGQRILKPDHRMHFFHQTSWRPFLLVALKTYAANAADCFNVRLPKQSNRQGGARAVDLPARSFDLAHPGVALPLLTTQEHDILQHTTSVLILLTVNILRKNSQEIRRLRSSRGTRRI